MEYLTEENFVLALEIAYQLIGVAAVITAATPSPKDNLWLKRIRKVLDTVAMNFGHAKNKE